MGKITFKKSKPYKGVDYTIAEKHRYSYYWQFKHQVPILSELPNEWIKWANLRFPYKLKMRPDDTGDYYDEIKFEPIKKGDVIYNFGEYIGQVSETKVGGDKENGYYVEIVYDKVFKTINNQRVLIDEIRVDKLDMRNLLWFYYYGLRISKLSDVRYTVTTGIIPYYTKLINEKDTLIKELKSELDEYKKILGNLDKRISQISYQQYRESEELKRPKPEPKKELSESDKKRIEDADTERTHRIYESIRQRMLDRDEYDRMPWLDKWGGTRP